MFGTGWARFDAPAAMRNIRPNRTLQHILISRPFNLRSAGGRVIYDAITIEIFRALVAPVAHAIRYLTNNTVEIHRATMLREQLINQGENAVKLGIKENHSVGISFSIRVYVARAKSCSLYLPENIRVRIEEIFFFFFLEISIVENDVAGILFYLKISDRG